MADGIEGKRRPDHATPARHVLALLAGRARGDGGRPRGSRARTPAHREPGDGAAGNESRHPFGRRTVGSGFAG